MNKLLLGAALVFLTAPAVSAQDFTFYDGGRMSFDYRQFPFGPLSGSFHADGELLDPTTFPPGGSGAASGFLGRLEGDRVMGAFGGILNPDVSADIAFLVLREGRDIVPGRYRIDPWNEGVTLAFIDDGVELRLPDGLEGLADFGWREWFLQVTAASRFLAIYGSLTIIEVTPERIRGTFEGLMADVEDETLIISVDNGEFLLTPLVVSVDETSWGHIKALYR